MIEILNNKWSTLAERERLLVTALSLVAVVGILWFGIITPLQQSAKQHTAAIDRARSELIEMQIDAKKFPAASAHKTSSINTDNAAFVQVDQSLKSANLKATQLSPSGDDTVRLRFERVDFDKLIVLLDQIDANFGLKTNKATFTKLDNGQVEAQLVVSR